MERFRVAHLSDLHVGEPINALGITDWKYAPQYPLSIKRGLGPSTYNPQILDAAILRLYQMHPSLDALLFSGDLATTGGRYDLQLAASALTAPAASAHRAASGRATFAALAGVIQMVFPGNHDRFQGISQQPGGTQFDATFLPPRWNPSLGMDAWVMQKGAEELAIVAGDLCLLGMVDADGALGWLGQGKAYPAVVDAMVKETAAQRKRSSRRAVAWAVHFPPEFAGIEPNLKLVNEANLIAAAQVSGIEHIFCGHTHDRRSYPAASTASINIHCGGTLSQYCAPQASGNCFDVFEIDVDAGVITSCAAQTYTWKGGFLGFQP